MTPTRTGEHVRVRVPVTEGRRQTRMLFADRRGRSVVRWHGDWWTIRKVPGTPAEFEIAGLA